MFDSMLGAVFIAALLSGVHCAAMCGGIVSALSLAQRPSKTIALVVSAANHTQKPTWLRQLLMMVAYNFGRITSYVVAGGLAGWLGSATFLLQKQLPLQQIALVLTNLLLMMMGLYLSGVWRGLVVLEAAGMRLWNGIRPWLQYATPMNTPQRAILAGMLWGWLPCGLVYSMLLTSLLSGSAIRGATIMLVWGLGTLPNLLLLGYAATKATLWLNNRWIRRLAGTIILAFGVLGFFRLDPVRHLAGLASFCWPGSSPAIAP